MTHHPEIPTTRMAVVGCGAVATQVHLPVLEAIPEVELVAVVDKDRTRARAVAKRFRAQEALTDHRQLSESVDAAVIALPNSLHAPVAVELLERGIDVLVEKPMALTESDCRAMLDAARQSKSLLGVGLFRRFYHLAKLTKEILDEGLLGEILSFDYREGLEFDWELASDYAFRKEQGGGVLLDMGAHVLDLLLWWFGDLQVVDFADDDFGGVAADAELRLARDGGAAGVVELSRMRTLRNTCVIRGTRASMEVGPFFPDASQGRIRLKAGNSSRVLTGTAFLGEESDRSVRDAYERQCGDFVDAVVHRRQPEVSGEEGLRAVRLMEACQSVRRSVRHAWI